MHKFEGGLSSEEDLKILRFVVNVLSNKEENSLVNLKLVFD